MLTELDGVTEQTQEVFLLAATNHLNKIDPAIRSRFTSEIEIPLPTESERFEMLKVFINDTKICFGTDKLKEIAAATSGKSGRDLNTMVTNAKRKAALRHMDNPDDLKVELSDFQIASLALG